MAAVIPTNQAEDINVALAAREARHDIHKEQLKDKFRDKIEEQKKEYPEGRKWEYVRSHSLKNHFCANWSLIPIILTVSSCAIGFFACFFYFGQPYFSIIFVVGFGGSLFAFYQAHKITQLENFAENYGGFIKDKT